MKSSKSFVSLAIESITGKRPKGNKDSIIELADKPSDDEIARIENIQMVIAGALISAYFTTATSSGTPFEGAEPHLQVLSAFALVFLGVKIIIVTIRPFGDHSWIEIIDRLLLHILFMISLLIGSAIILLSIVEVNIKGFIPIGYNAETGLALSIVGVVSGLYGTWVNKKMADLGTSMPEHSLTVPSGSSGSTLPLTLKNNTGEILSPNDVKLIVDSPESVNVEINSAREIEPDIWHPLVPLQAGAESQIDVNFTRVASKDEITNEEVNITVVVNGEIQEVHVAKLRI